jgi:hypothetical protein
MISDLRFLALNKFANLGLESSYKELEMKLNQILTIALGTCLGQILFALTIMVFWILLGSFLLRSISFGG